MTKKISELGVAGTLGFDDLAPVVQGGATVKATVEQLRRFSGVRLTQTTSRAIVSGAVWSWTTEDYDTDNYWDPASSTMIVAPFSGFYQAKITCNPVSNWDGAARLRINGVDRARQNCSGQYQCPVVTHTTRLNPGDRVEAAFDNFAGGAHMAHWGLYISLDFLGR